MDSETKTTLANAAIRITNLLLAPLILSWVYGWLVRPELHTPALSYWGAFGVCWCMRLATRRRRKET